MTIECPTCSGEVVVELPNLKADPTKMEERLLELLGVVIATQRELLKSLEIMATPKFFYAPPAQPAPIGSPSPWEVTCNK